MPGRKKVKNPISRNTGSDSETNIFVSLARELQEQALAMWDATDNISEKDLYKDIFQLTVSAEKYAIAGDMNRAWKNIGKIINNIVINE